MEEPESRRDGGARTPEPGLAFRVQLWGFLQLSVANVMGAVLTFVYFTFLVPSAPQVRDIGIDQRILSLILFAGYAAVVSPFALVRSFRRFRPVRRWLSEGRPPSAKELETTVAMPWIQARLFFRLWVLAAVIFGGLNLYFEPAGRQALRVFSGVLAAGMITAALNYLLVERTMRPVFVRALRGTRLERPRRVGIRARLVLLWLLGSGLPLLAVAVSRLLEGTGVAAFQESLWFVGLGGLLAGFLITWTAARSLADPIDDVRQGLERVEEGDVDVEVPVNDTGEIGLLQSGFNRMVEGLRERRRIEDLFGRHVGVEVARRALDRGIALGGERREASVLFCDITGSTGLAETLPPEGVVEMLNAFFSAVFRAVDAEGGWVNKFEGDGAMCVFGVPDDKPDHAAAALRAAQALREGLAELRGRYPGLEAGIGVSSGEVVAGDVGAEDRYEYTVIGDPVNEAARLTEESKRRPSGLLAAERSVRWAGAEGWTTAGTFSLRGRRLPSTVYEPRHPAAPVGETETR